MKEKWNKPLLIIIPVAVEDIITTSPGGGSDNPFSSKDENLGEWD